MLFILPVNVSFICFFLFLIGALCICMFMLLMGFFFGGCSMITYSKNIPFESGIDPFGNARLRFSIRFYLIGMLFVIFDAEALYFYIWSVVIRESSWFGLIEMIIFSSFLLLGLLYLIDMGVLHGKDSAYYVKNQKN